MGAVLQVEDFCVIAARPPKADFGTHAPNITTYSITHVKAQ